MKNELISANLEIFIKYKWASWQTETDLLGFPQTGGWWWWRRMREGKKLSLSSEVGKYWSRWWRGGVWSISGVHEICPTFWCCGVFYKYFTNIFAPRFDSSFSYKLILKSKYGERTIIEAKYFQLFIVPLFSRVDMECSSKHFSFLISPFLFLKTLAWYKVDCYGYPITGCRL